MKKNNWLHKYIAKTGMVTPFSILVVITVGLITTDGRATASELASTVITLIGVNLFTFVHYLHTKDKKEPERRFDKEYIVCSAIYLPSVKKKMTFPPKNIDKGLVVTGYRHNNCFEFIEKAGYTTNAKVEHIQGFLTSKNQFVDRKRAYYIALEAGQIEDKLPTKSLISEDIY